MSLKYGRGDRGKTDLLGAVRVYKDDLRVEAYGTLDELNSFLGLVKNSINEEDIASLIERIQEHLFVMGSEIASLGTDVKGIPKVEKDMVEELDRMLERYESEISPLTSFILPGGSTASCFLHVARSVARRAERRLVSLSRSYEINENTLAYINRLSSLLFVLARLINLRMGYRDREWKRKG